VWRVSPPLHLDQFAIVGFGSNPQGFSDTPASFNGGFEPKTYAPAESRAFVARNLEALGVRAGPSRQGLPPALPD
jgi:hypothetical protein